MSDYINEIVPVADGDADGNYPWMVIRSGSAIQSKFKNLTVVGPLNGGNYFPYNDNVNEFFSIFALNNTVPSPPNAAYSTLIPVGPPDRYLREGANSVLLASNLNDGVITKPLTAANLVTKVYFEVDVVGDSAIAGDSISIGAALAGADPLAENRVTLNVPAIDGVPVKFRVASAMTITMLAAAGETILLKFFNNTAPNVRGILVKNVKFIGIAPPVSIP